MVLFHTRAVRQWLRAQAGALFIGCCCIWGVADGDGAVQLENASPVFGVSGDRRMTSYTSKDYSHLIGMSGFSEGLLRNHIALYQGYVKNTNALIEKLSDMQNTSHANTPEFAEIKRRFGWEYNGMRLHELYFDNLSKSNASLMEASHSLANAINQQYGSYEAWQRDFVATGSMRGIGWVILCVDPATHRFFNVWVNEHDGGHLSGTRPLLVMDVFEHAYMLDYGLKKADYIDAFLKAVDWKVVSKRFDAR